MEIAPGLSAKYALDVETVIHSREHYRSDEWLETDLPGAPSIMIDDDVIVEGSDISEAELENEIRSRS